MIREIQAGPRARLKDFSFEEQEEIHDRVAERMKEFGEVEEEARKHGRGKEGNNGNLEGGEQEATKEAWRRQRKGKEPKPRKPRMF